MQKERKDKKHAGEPAETYINNYILTLKAAGQSPKTLESRRIQLVRMAIDLNVTTVSNEELVTWLANKNWANETRKSNRAAIRGFFSYLFHTHIRTDDPAFDLPSVRPSRPLPHPCPDQYITNALEQVHNNKERLMIILAAGYGLRRCEICRIHSNDIINDAYGGYALIIHGKGNKERSLPISTDIAMHIIAEHGYLYPGRYPDTHVEESYIGKRLSDLLPNGWSGHSLRHRFATTAYCKTHDIFAVSRALGHESVATTQRYVALPVDALQNIISATNIE